jgi:phosphoglycerate dehydrogenase-like enzyme
VVVLMSARVPAELREVARRAALDGGRPAEIRLYADREEFAAGLREAEVLYGGLRPGEVAGAPHLRWVHVTSAGVDGLPLAELRAAGVVLTNARGQHADSAADHAFALLLALSRKVAEAVRHQAERRWVHLAPEVLAGRRLGILGFGSIGQAVARRAHAFGMEVWASRRHPEPHPLVARMFGPSRAELLELLGGVDDVVAVLPSTPATRGQLDREALGVLRPGARLVNIGRGDLLDEAALDEALRAGRLAGAGLDCLPREPLPPDSPLWSAPNLVITPHIAGAHPDYAERGMAIFADNLRRFCRGEPLRNVVDLEAGY